MQLQRAAKAEDHYFAQVVSVLPRCPDDYSHIEHLKKKKERNNNNKNKALGPNATELEVPREGPG